MIGSHSPFQYIFFEFSPGFLIFMMRRSAQMMGGSGGRRGGGLFGGVMESTAKMVNPSDIGVKFQ